MTDDACDAERDHAQTARREALEEAADLCDARNDPWKARDIRTLIDK